MSVCVCVAGGVGVEYHKKCVSSQKDAGMRIIVNSFQNGPINHYDSYTSILK